MKSVLWQGKRALYWGVWAGSSGQDFMVLLMNGTCPMSLLSLLCFGTRMRWNQNRNGAGAIRRRRRGLWNLSEGPGSRLRRGISVECRWHLTQGEWQRWRGAESVPLMGELWIISQSKTVVDCLSLGTSRLEASPAGCKIQVQVWNKSYWWSQEISGAAVIQELNLGVNYLPVP